MANNKVRIRSGDTVLVIAGKDRGKTGKVLRVIPEDSRVVVEGIKVVKRHQKPAGEQRGGVIFKEAPIHVSNVALWDVENQRRVKVGFKVEGDAKLRVDRKTGASIDKA